MTIRAQLFSGNFVKKRNWRLTHPYLTLKTIFGQGGLYFHAAQVIVLPTGLLQGERSVRRYKEISVNNTQFLSRGRYMNFLREPTSWKTKVFSCESKLSANEILHWSGRTARKCWIFDRNMNMNFTSSLNSHQTQHIPENRFNKSMASGYWSTTFYGAGLTSAGSALVSLTPSTHSLTRSFRVESSRTTSGTKTSLAISDSTRFMRIWLFASLKKSSSWGKVFTVIYM